MREREACVAAVNYNGAPQHVVETVAHFLHDCPYTLIERAQSEILRKGCDPTTGGVNGAALQECPDPEMNEQTLLERLKHLGAMWRLRNGASFGD